MTNQESWFLFKATLSQSKCHLVASKMDGLLQKLRSNRCLWVCRSIKKNNIWPWQGKGYVKHLHGKKKKKFHSNSIFRFCCKTRVINSGIKCFTFIFWDFWAPLLSWFHLKESIHSDFLCIFAWTFGPCQIAWRPIHVRENLRFDQGSDCVSKKSLFSLKKHR